MKQDRMCSSHVMSSLTLPVTASSFMSLLVLFSLSLLLLPCHCPCSPSLPPSPTTIHTSQSRPRSLFITSYPLHHSAVLHHVGLHHSILYTRTHTYIPYIHTYISVYNSHAIIPQCESLHRHPWVYIPAAEPA